MSVCRTAGFKAEAYAPNHEEDYIKTLITLVDDNQAPIVFFDLDKSWDGQNEHAAVVVGYYHNQSGETHFIITQFGLYYDFNGMELARSSLYSLKEQREAETFTKVWNASNSATEWRLFPQKSISGMVLPVPERTAKPKAESETALRGKIMVVTGPIITPFIDNSFFAQTHISDEPVEVVRRYSV